MATALGTHLLAFPITHMTPDLAFDEPAYRTHLDWIVNSGPAAVFSAGGTGEFFSLSAEEVETVTRTTVQDVKGKMPVISGAGYGTAMAIDLAKRAERAGANGILLLPPYLVNSSQAGLWPTWKRSARAVLGVIVYNRDNAISADTLARPRRALPEPRRLQGRHRRHRADGADVAASSATAWSISAACRPRKHSRGPISTWA